MTRSPVRNLASAGALLCKGWNFCFLAEGGFAPDRHLGHTWWPTIHPFCQFCWDPHSGHLNKVHDGAFHLTWFRQPFSELFQPLYGLVETSAKCPCMGLAVRDPSEPEAVVSPCIAAAHSSIIGGRRRSIIQRPRRQRRHWLWHLRGHGSRSNAGTFWAARGAVVLKGQHCPETWTCWCESPLTDSRDRCAQPQLFSATTSPNRAPFSGLLSQKSVWLS